MSKPIIGLSRCFLENVRYDGGIINDDFVKKLKNYVDYIDFCPEVDIGLSVPRPKIIIKEVNNEKRLIQPETGRDLTEKMNKYIEETIKNLKEIDGFILKSKSPSCGINSAKVYKNDKKISKTDGFFAGAIKKEFPYLPIEDENRLKNKEIRRHFLIKVFAFYKLRELIKNPSIKKLIEFHTNYKYLLMTYNQKNLKELGKIVADKISLEEKLSKYKIIFYQSFLKRPSVKRHYNTLMHIFGHISKELTKEEKKHLLNLIEKYKKGLIELEIVFELFKYLSVRFKNQYLLMQKYFFPYPEELDK